MFLFIYYLKNNYKIGNSTTLYGLIELPPFARTQSPMYIIEEYMEMRAI